MLFFSRNYRRRKTGWARKSARGVCKKDGVQGALIIDCRVTHGQFERWKSAQHGTTLMRRREKQMRKKMTPSFLSLSRDKVAESGWVHICSWNSTWPEGRNYGAISLPVTTSHWNASHKSGMSEAHVNMAATYLSWKAHLKSRGVKGAGDAESLVIRH